MTVGSQMTPTPDSAVIARTGPCSVRGLPDWEVREAFPSYLEYAEGPRRLRFGAELAGGSRVDIILYDDPGCLRWEPPHATDRVDPIVEHRAVVRVSAALALLGIRPAWETLRGRERPDWPVIQAEVAALLRRA